MTEKKDDQNINRKKTDNQKQTEIPDDKKSVHKTATEPEASGKKMADKETNQRGNDEDMSAKEKKRKVADDTGGKGSGLDEEGKKKEGENGQPVNEQELSEDIRDEKFLELQAKYDELNDRYLRLFSEFDNYRKRTVKEKLELIKTASEDIIKLLLPIIDDLDRALESADNEGDQNSTKEGIELILNKLKTVLRQKGVEEIKAMGEEFNTDIHEAVSNQPAESDEDKGKIVDVVQKGYILNGKVLRYAKVVVAN